jgi:hypothetical protein
MPDLLTIGPVHTLVQNVGYALPARSVRVRSNGAVETSQDNSTYAAVTLTNNEFDTAAAFIRTTAATALVTVRAR